MAYTRPASKRVSRPRLLYFFRDHQSTNPVVLSAAVQKLVDKYKKKFNRDPNVILFHPSQKPQSTVVIAGLSIGVDQLVGVGNFAVTYLDLEDVVDEQQ